MSGPWIEAGTSSPFAYLGVAVSEPLQPTGSCPAPLFGSGLPFLHRTPKKATRRWWIPGLLLGLGDGLGVGDGVGLGVGDGVGLGLGVGVGLGVALGLGVGFGVGVALGDGVGDGVPLGLGVGLGPGDAEGFGDGLVWITGVVVRDGKAIGLPRSG
jgi:hypothetical protein